MKTYLLLFFNLISFALISQNVAQLNFNEQLTFEAGSKATLFGDNIRLREHPNTISNELALLKIGSEVQILEKTETFKTINGLKSRWLKVKTNKNEGYILDCFISIDTHKNNNYLVLTNYRKSEDRKIFLRVRLHNTKLEEYVEKEYHLPHSSIEVHNSNNKGLTDITNILYIDYVAQACGMNGGGKYIFINDNDIIDEIDLYEVSEGRMLWKTEKIIFPIDDEKLDENSFKFEQEMSNVIDESTSWYKKTIIERQHRIVNGKITPKIKSEEKQ